MKSTSLLISLIGSLSLFAVRPAACQLVIGYGPSGIETLKYNGVVLEDVRQYPDDAFHIFHMKMADGRGHALQEGQYGWGEANSGKSWNNATKTWTYRFSWGSIECRFVQKGSELDVQVKETNLPGSGAVLDGVTLYPFGLHLPNSAGGFWKDRGPQLAFNTTGPSVTVANLGTGEVVVTDMDATKPLYTGFWPEAKNDGYSAIISSTTPDALPVFDPRNDRPVFPGQTDTFTVAYRFARAGTPVARLAAATYANWAKAWPVQLKWPDRRPIGTIYLATSPAGSDTHRPEGYPNNPRRYFNDNKPADFDVRTQAGLVAFQQRVLRQAADNVSNMRRLHAQGAITWDIEGEAYPQGTTYVCAPDQIARIAPEMESQVRDPGSPYNGMRLDDAYFKTMRDAGFRVGVCVRPQRFVLQPDGTARQVYLSVPEIVPELIRKMKFAHDRWGATLFYFDTTVEPDGAVLNANVLQAAAKAMPDSLLIPEESTPKDYAYTAPFQSLIFHGDVGTDPVVHAYYPKAFSAILINDVDPIVLSAKTPSLTSSVRSGDILMSHVDYWQKNDQQILAIYDAAKRAGPQSGALRNARYDVH